MNNATAKEVRCAIYTRKSVEDKDDVRFTSPQAQRKSCEELIAEHAKRGENWMTCPELYYEDYGKSGGNMNRPELQRLIADIKKKLVDAVVLYSLDRLNRNVKDFTELQELFLAYGVSYYSVMERHEGTAPFEREFIDNIMMSVAQRQRKEAAVKVKDKLTRMAEEGMRVCGSPVIGYDIVDKAWVPNESETQQAQDIFNFYIKTKSISATVRALNAKGYRTKQWTTPKKLVFGGKPYSKSTVHHLLRNPVYIGKIRYAGNIYKGKHEPIISTDIFEKAQDIMTQNGASCDSLTRGEADLWLKGKLHCATCGSAMTPSWATSKGKRFCYYECTKARSLGKELCPVRRISAEIIHKVILKRLEFLGEHLSLLRDCYEELEKNASNNKTAFEAELTRVNRKLVQVKNKGDNLADYIAQGSARENSFIIQEKIQALEERQRDLVQLKTELQQKISSSPQVISYKELQRILAHFPIVIAQATPNERKELADLLIREVNYDEAKEKIVLSIYPLIELPEQSFEIDCGVRINKAVTRRSQEGKPLFRKASNSTERVGFEPTRGVNPYRFSRPAP